MSGAKYKIKICSWNVNGNISKLESLANLLLDFDVIFLLELKIAYPFSVPGFSCIRSLIVKGEELQLGVV